MENRRFVREAPLKEKRLTSAVRWSLGDPLRYAVLMYFTSDASIPRKAMKTSLSRYITYVESAPDRFVTLPKLHGKIRVLVV